MMEALPITGFHPVEEKCKVAKQQKEIDKEGNAKETQKQREIKKHKVGFLRPSMLAVKKHDVRHVCCKGGLYGADILFSNGRGCAPFPPFPPAFRRTTLAVRKERYYVITMFAVREGYSDHFVCKCGGYIPQCRAIYACRKRSIMSSRLP